MSQIFKSSYFGDSLDFGLINLIHIKIGNIQLSDDIHKSELDIIGLNKPYYSDTRIPHL